MCGIAGFFGKKKKSFNTMILNYLLLAQDSRGKDNFGIAYSHLNNGKKREITIRRGENRKSSGGEDLSTFHKLFEKEAKFWEGDTKPIFPTNSWVLGHSRSASRGSNDVENAHPFVIQDNPNRLVIGVHNGTITNESELERKFDIKSVYTKTDSQLLFEIMSKGQDETIELLKSYRGSAALVWYIHQEPNKIYVWTGRETYTKNHVPERPLHYIETINGIYISSESKPIHDIMLTIPNWKAFLGENSISVYHFKLDAITVIENGVITEEIEIERKNTYTSSSNHISFGPGKKERSSCDTTADNCGNNLSTYQIGTTKDGIEAESRKIFETDVYHVGRINELRNDLRLYLSKGLYHLDGQVADTKVGLDVITNELSVVDSNIHFDSIGRSLKKAMSGSGWCFNDEFMTSAANVTPFTLYFYKGILVKSEEHLLNLHKHEKNTNGVVSPVLLRMATEHPIWVGLFAKFPEGVPGPVVFTSPSTPGVAQQTLTGLHIFPFVNKGYVFAGNFVMDIISGDRLRAIIKNGEVKSTHYCTGCKTTVSKVCIACEEEEEVMSTKKALDAYDVYLNDLKKVVSAYGVEAVKVVCDDCGVCALQEQSKYCENCSSINVEEMETYPEEENYVHPKIKLFLEH